MIFGVLQKLNILNQTNTELVLREQPLLEWLVAGVLFIVAINLALFEFWWTTGAAILMAIYTAARAQTRLIHIDANQNTLVISLNSLLRSQEVAQELLSDISRAYLHKDENGATQIVLVRVDGEEMGLSVYSKDTKPWKEEITIAINTVLHEAHRDDSDPDAII